MIDNSINKRFVHSKKITTNIQHPFNNTDLSGTDESNDKNERSFKSKYFPSSNKFLMRTQSAVRNSCYDQERRPNNIHKQKTAINKNNVKLKKEFFERRFLPNNSGMGNAECQRREPSNSPHKTLRSRSINSAISNIRHHKIIYETDDSPTNVSIDSDQPFNKNNKESNRSTNKTQSLFPHRRTNHNTNRNYEERKIVDDDEEDDYGFLSDAISLRRTMINSINSNTNSSIQTNNNNTNNNNNNNNNNNTDVSSKYSIPLSRYDNNDQYNSLQITPTNFNEDLYRDQLIDGKSASIIHHSNTQALIPPPLPERSRKVSYHDCSSQEKSCRNSSHDNQPSNIYSSLNRSVFRNGRQKLSAHSFHNCGMIPNDSSRNRKALTEINDNNDLYRHSIEKDDSEIITDNYSYSTKADQCVTETVLQYSRGNSVAPMMNNRLTSLSTTSSSTSPSLNSNYGLHRMTPTTFERFKIEQQSIGAFRMPPKDVDAAFHSTASTRQPTPLLGPPKCITPRRLTSSFLVDVERPKKKLHETGINAIVQSNETGVGTSDDTYWTTRDTGSSVRPSQRHVCMETDLFQHQRDVALQNELGKDGLIKRYDHLSSKSCMVDMESRVHMCQVSHKGTTMSNGMRNNQRNVSSFTDQILQRDVAIQEVLIDEDIVKEQLTREKLIKQRTKQTNTIKNQERNSSTQIDYKQLGFDRDPTKPIPQKTIGTQFVQKTPTCDAEIDCSVDVDAKSVQVTGNQWKRNDSSQTEPKQLRNQCEGTRKVQQADSQTNTGDDNYLRYRTVECNTEPFENILAEYARILQEEWLKHYKPIVPTITRGINSREILKKHIGCDTKLDNVFGCCTVGTDTFDRDFELKRNVAVGWDTVNDRICDYCDQRPSIMNRGSNTDSQWETQRNTGCGTIMQDLRKNLIFESNDQKKTKIISPNHPFQTSCEYDTLFNNNQINTYDTPQSVNLLQQCNNISSNYSTQINVGQNELENSMNNQHNHMNDYERDTSQKTYLVNPPNRRFAYDMRELHTLPIIAEKPNENGSSDVSSTKNVQFEIDEMIVEETIESEKYHDNEKYKNNLKDIGRKIEKPSISISPPPPSPPPPPPTITPTTTTTALHTSNREVEFKEDLNMTDQTVKTVLCTDKQFLPQISPAGSYSSNASTDTVTKGKISNEEEILKKQTCEKKEQKTVKFRATPTIHLREPSVSSDSLETSTEKSPEVELNESNYENIIDEELITATKILNDYLMNPTKADKTNVSRALNIIQQVWFSLVAQENVNSNLVISHLNMFSSFSKLLLERIVNMTDINGNTAMHYSVSFGHWTVANKLLETNVCDVGTHNKAGYTPVMLTALCELNNDDDDTTTSTMTTSSSNNSNISVNQSFTQAVMTRIFVESYPTSINCHSSGTDGMTALHLASLHSRLHSAKLLLSVGANVNMVDVGATKQTSIHIILNKLGETMKMLEENSKVKNKKHFESAIEQTVEYKLLELFLNEKDVDLKILDHEQRNPIQLAEKLGLEKIGNKLKTIRERLTRSQLAKNNSLCLTNSSKNHKLRHQNVYHSPPRRTASTSN
ncbi:hypothetical protein SNEBB_008715 [Seison nebaliae]|nr:hypothetical protein SNEBB_008715 [Seison nebaliae]